MQTIGYVIDIDGQPVSVLVRHHRTYRAFKTRNRSEKVGVFFSDETDYLKNYPERMNDLKSGKVIKL